MYRYINIRHKKVSARGYIAPLYGFLALEHEPFDLMAHYSVTKSADGFTTARGLLQTQIGLILNGRGEGGGLSVQFS